jgi:hypothetical protein
MSIDIRIATYVYPGWHSELERKDERGQVLNEWSLLRDAKPLFDGHRQPRVPLNIYDDSLPKSSEWQIGIAKRYGIDVFIYCFYWSFGRRFLYKPLDDAFLKCSRFKDVEFAIMWANRLPRGILPIRERKGPVIHPSRFVYTNKDDFLKLIKYIAENYFCKENYAKVNGRYLFSIFDSTFFIRDTGTEGAREIIDNSRRWLTSNGYNDIYLMAINPAPSFISEYKKAGFDAISHYVFLPDWKGEFLQDYRWLIRRRVGEWREFANRSGLPYYPSVSPGWDATPRGRVEGKKPPKRYPYWPIVVNENPEDFKWFLKTGLDYNIENNRDSPIQFVTSLNEWSEGHYLEPDSHFGYGFLEAIKNAKEDI